MRAYVAGAHAAGINGEDLVVEAPELAVVASDELGLEGALTVTRDLDLEGALVAAELLGGRSVATVGLALRGLLSALVAEVVGDLGLEGAVDESGSELLEKAVLANEVLGGLVALEEEVDEFVWDRGPVREIEGLFGFSFGVVHIGHFGLLGRSREADTQNS